MDLAVVDDRKSSPLVELVAAFEALGPEVDRASAGRLLGTSALTLRDVAPFVEESERMYTRRRVARTEAFEMLVLTWRPAEKSAPHDHAGSLCAMKILAGQMRETRFACAIDGLVDPIAENVLCEDEVVVDGTEDIHALENPADSRDTVVTLHVYAPPLPELRRYVARDGAPKLRALRPKRDRPGPTVVVVGGGFSGTLAAAHLLKRATDARAPIHVMVFDRQSALGEGAAYRTVDAGHLLNVPASNMSAWPDRPGDFLAWAKARDASVAPTDFLPRKLYGEYVRATFADVAAHAYDGASAEIRRAEVQEVRACDDGWKVTPKGGALVHADAVVLATGHRPPDDPLRDRWRGPRARYIGDPWASLALSTIRPDEPVVLLGSGLTAIDVLLTLTRTPRSAPVIAISRRGLLPNEHRVPSRPPIDPRAWLEPLLEAPTARSLVSSLRDAIDHAACNGEDWRAVVDGLRPHLTTIWRSLPPEEASRFLRHVRPFWEVLRHRIPPAIAARVRELGENGSFRTIAARVRSADANREGVSIEIAPRGGRSSRSIRTAWVVNCTGPGAWTRANAIPVVGSLIEAGHLEADPFGLGVLTDDDGRALARGRAREDLVVIGTLRKAQLWESTAVPELRVQAANVARAVMSAQWRA